MAEIKGIDVSANQGNINWKTVANYGMGFAILRITEKGNVVDPTFEKNYKGCIENKIPVGVYKYSYATSIEQIKTEANIVVKTLNKRELDYPVFLDIEDKCQRNISKSTMMQMIDAFRAIILKAGYKFGIYCGESWYNTYLPDSAKKYDCWIAHYPDPDNGTMQTRVKPSVGIGWQYSSKATIPGIPTKVDRSVFYKDYSSINNTNNSTTNKQEGGNKLTKEQAINALIAVAKNEIGYLEKATNAQLDSKTANAGYNNYTKYWRDIYPAYQTQPWCACQISWDMMTAFGLETAKKLLKHWPYVYCPTMANLFTLYANPQVGDIVIFWSSKKKEFVHTGLVIKVQGDQFWTIEGNTSGASGIVANGGGVCQKSYYNSQLPGTKFCRPDYSIVTSIKSNSTTNTSTTTATTKNWIEYGDKGNDVKALQTKLNKVGYKLEVDGVCGNATVDAIKDFQKKYNLAVDGQAGKNTITKLDSVIAAKENKNFKTFVGACTTNSTPVYQKTTGTTALATYPKLNKGNLVDVIGLSGSRYKIKIANTYTGYIDKTKITTPDKLITKYPHGVCTGNDVAVRKNAGTSYAKISGYPTLNKNDEVDILGSKKDSSGNKWKKVRIAAKYTGYVFGKYIKQD